METIVYTLATKMDFLFEKCNEPYIWYGEVSLAKEKSIVVQESLRSSRDYSGLAGKDGV